MPEPRCLTAAFLDRDGTIIVDRDYTNDPDDVVLLPDAAAAIARLYRAGFSSIIVTNQSGIARGKVSLSQYRAVRQRVDDLLRAEGAGVADTFACPHHPEFTGPCGCRKPETGLYERAAAVYDLDLSKCLYIGDRMRDIAPAAIYSARSALVRSPITREDDVAYAHAAGAHVVDSLAQAVRALLADER